MINRECYYYDYPRGSPIMNDHERRPHWNKTGTRNVRLPVPQAEIARRTGFSPAAISRILGRGRRTNDIRPRHREDGG